MHSSAGIMPNFQSVGLSANKEAQVRYLTNHISINDRQLSTATWLEKKSNIFSSCLQETKIKVSKLHNEIFTGPTRRSTRHDEWPRGFLLAL